jgi:hypothetical protein
MAKKFLLEREAALNRASQFIGKYVKIQSVSDTVMRVDSVKTYIYNRDHVGVSFIGSSYSILKLFKNTGYSLTKSTIYSSGVYFLDFVTEISEDEFIKSSLRFLSKVK